MKKMTKKMLAKCPFPNPVQVGEFAVACILENGAYVGRRGKFHVYVLFLPESSWSPETKLVCPCCEKCGASLTVPRASLGCTLTRRQAEKVIVWLKKHLPKEMHEARKFLLHRNASRFYGYKDIIGSVATNRRRAGAK